MTCEDNRGGKKVKNEKESAVSNEREGLVNGKTLAGNSLHQPGNIPTHTHNMWTHSSKPQLLTLTPQLYFHNYCFSKETYVQTDHCYPPPDIKCSILCTLSGPVTRSFLHSEMSLPLTVIFSMS